MEADHTIPCENSTVIMLGAGRPARGEHPSALRKTPDQRRILDWISDAYSELNADWHFIGGFQLEEMVRAYPHINYSINSEWRDTGSCASLFIAPLDKNSTNYVSYTDIIFNRQVVNDLRHKSGDVVLAVDTLWKDRYENRAQTDILAAEKVCLDGDSVTAVGADLELATANAEFVGLLKLSPKAIEKVLEIQNRESSRFDKAPLPTLISCLVEEGLSVRSIDVCGNWAELNAPQDLARYVLGTKAETLARLRPMVKKSIIGEQYSFSVKQWKNAETKVIKCIQDKFKNMSLAVRSSALSEDGWVNSNAGAYLSLINIPSADSLALTGAIDRVVASYPDGDFENQILLQKVVENVRISGVVVTRTLNTGAPYYTINYDAVSQRTDTVTGGDGKHLRTLIVHRTAEKLPADADPSFNDLIGALKELENLVGYDSLDVEFIITNDNQVVVLQLRPIAVNHNQWKAHDSQIEEMLLSAQNQFELFQAPAAMVHGTDAPFGVMPDWNPAEIIGVKPRNLSLSLYRYLVTDEIWAMQRSEYGYVDVSPQPLMKTFMGHPYIDIRVCFNSFVPEALSEDLAARLVTYYLKKLKENPELHDKVEFDILFTCWSFDFSDQASRLKEGGFSDADVTVLEEALKTITKNGFDRLDEDLRQIKLLELRRLEIMGTNACPLEKAILLLDDCRRYGTLPFAHLARAGFVAFTLLRSSVASGIISEERQDDFMSSLSTVAKKFTYDGALVAEGQLSRRDFFEQYGHLRPGTYEITSARYDSDPDRFLEPMITLMRDDAQAEADFVWSSEEKQGLEEGLRQAEFDVSLDTLEQFMRAAIEGREYAKFQFTRNLSDALELLVAWGSTHELSREHVSHLDLETLLVLRSRTALPNYSEWLNERVEEGSRLHLLAQAVELPPLLMCVDDLTAFHYPDSQPNFISTNKVTAPVADLSDGADPDQDLAGHIVFIPRADPGYDWLFGQDIVGLVTIFGGANSHMAIRAAEFSLPAAIGIGETQYELMRHARTLELDCSSRQIHVLQ